VIISYLDVLRLVVRPVETDAPFVLVLTLDLLRRLTQLSLLAHLAFGSIAAQAHCRLIFEFVLRQNLDNGAMPR